MDSYARDMLDDKVSKNIVGDLRKHLPPGGFPKHKPVVSYNGKISAAAGSNVNKRGSSQSS